MLAICLTRAAATGLSSFEPPAVLKAGDLFYNARDLGYRFDRLNRNLQNASMWTGPLTKLFSGYAFVGINIPSSRLLNDRFWQ